MPRLPPWLAGLALGVGLALLMTSSLWTAPGEPVLGHGNLDVWSHLWGMHWFVDSLVHLRAPWTIVGASFPEHRVLWYIDPLGALLTAPVNLLFGARAAWNTEVFLQVVLGAFCGWGMGRAYGGRGWLAGTAVATMPLIQTEIWNGVIEAAWIAPIAASLWAAARRSRWTGVLLGLTGLATPYHGIGAALLVGLVVLLGGTEEGRAEAGVEAPGWRERAIDMAWVVGLAAAVAMPHFLLTRASFESGESFVHRAFYVASNDPALSINAADPRALLHPGDFWSRPANDDWLSPPWKHSPYLGWVLVVGAVVGCVRRPQLLAVFGGVLTLVVFALGYYLWWDEQWLSTAEGGRYTLPLYWIAEPAGISLTHHVRFVGAAIVGLALLAERGAGRWSGLVAPLVALEFLFLGPNCFPLPTADATMPRALAELPDDGLAVVDLPSALGNGYPTDRFLYWQSVHAHPVPWNNRVGSRATANFNPALRRMALLSADRFMLNPNDPGVPPSDTDWAAAAEELGELGFGYAVLHEDYCQTPRMCRAHELALEELFGPPERVDKSLVYRFGGASEGR